VTSDDAREHLEAAVRRIVPPGPQANTVVNGILALADAYREAKDEAARLREAHRLAVALKRDGRPVPLGLAAANNEYYRRRKAAQRARARGTVAGSGNVRAA
jgi:hypothetical protein